MIHVNNKFQENMVREGGGFREGAELKLGESVVEPKEGDVGSFAEGADRALARSMGYLDDQDRLTREGVHYFRSLQQAPSHKLPPPRLGTPGGGLVREALRGAPATAKAVQKKETLREVAVKEFDPQEFETNSKQTMHLHFVKKKRAAQLKGYRLTTHVDGRNCKIELFQKIAPAVDTVDEYEVAPSERKIIDISNSNGEGLLRRFKIELERLFP